MSPLITEDPIENPDRPGLWMYDNKVMFPIWWLNDQAYCEYKIYLQLEKGIKVEKSKEMLKGSQIHNNSYIDFKKTSIPSTFENMVEKSKIEPLLSREFRFRSLKYGIIGRADCICFYPDKFIVVDDKPGPKKYPPGTNEPWETDKHQVYGYCLALKEKMIEEFQDSRKIISSLRSTKTKEIYWEKIFDDDSENKIIGIINRIHRLISLEEEYIPTENPGKCKGCNLNKECDRNVLNKLIN